MGLKEEGVQRGHMAELPWCLCQGFLICEAKLILSDAVGMAEWLGPGLRCGLKFARKGNEVLLALRVGACPAWV